MPEHKFQSVDQQYRKLVKRILTEGVEKTDPQKVGNLSINGHLMSFDLSGGTLPLLGLRDLSDKQGTIKAIIGELMWFIEGDTNAKGLHNRGIHFWDPWMEPTQKEFGYPEGELGPIYGKQWRAFAGGGKDTVDQLTEAMRLLKENPDSRRIAVTAWNPKEINEVFVAPCIRYFQFHHAQGVLGMSVVQGSADVGVGVPFDTAEYALLLLMAAKVNNMKPGILNHFLIDAHIYKDHVNEMKGLIRRKATEQPKMIIHSDPKSIFDFKEEDFELVNYHPNPRLRMKAAI